MQIRTEDFAFWTNGFFRIGQSHDTLANYYEMCFNLKKYHGWDVDEINNLLPFERDVYALLTRQWIEEEERKARERAMGSK